MLSVTQAFSPLIIKGLQVRPNDPFKFDFIVDKGEVTLDKADFDKEMTRLVKYFLAALTVPEQDLWVNLSPYEKDRIIPQTFGQTEMGRDLLAQDYMLKQLSSSLVYPEKETGRKFWARVYAQAREKFGSTNVPADTFNKIWIVPDQAVVYEGTSGAFILKSRLKVLLKEDYLALAKTGGIRHGTHDIASQIMREVLVPEIEKEVNEGRTFAGVRQIYDAVILACWYKQALKQSLLNQIYVNQNKTLGVNVKDPAITQKIFNQYTVALKKGVYNFIKEETDPQTGKTIPRKYFSGGTDLAAVDGILQKEHTVSPADRAMLREAGNRAVSVEADVAPVQAARLFTPANDMDKEAKTTGTLAVLQAMDRILQALKEDLFSAPPSSFVKPDANTWAGRNADPQLAKYTEVSLQFEAGLDRGLIKKLTAKYGSDMTRFIAQVTMTGGLGALMHDLMVAWKKNGADSLGILPLYDDIKGPSGVKQLFFGEHFLGNRIRTILGPPTDVSFDLELQGSRFAQNANTQESRDIIGKKISVTFYKAETLFGKAPQWYMDAYYTKEGKKSYIFNQLYADNDWRSVQMAVYNQAAQRLLKILQERGEVKDNIIFIENEVPVSLPKKLFPAEKTIRQHMNHTVVEAGLYRPPEYAFEMLGFEESLRPLIVRDGTIGLAEYAALSSDFVSGVGLYEHTGVLKNRLLPPYRNNIWGFAQDGMRSTNGALLDMWQGPEVRDLIDLYKERLNVPGTDDKKFFDLLNTAPHAGQREEFIRFFEYIKSLYALDLLLFLNTAQPQEMGGSQWLGQILGQSGPGAPDAQDLREKLSQFIKTSLSSGQSISKLLKKLDDQFGSLKEALLRNPVIANVRRQVSYKGPDMYLDILRKLRDPVEREKFRASGTRLIIGGRLFDESAVGLFQQLKDLASELDLGDRFAFIDDYNISDAPVIFRGVAGSVMLSDEFLEASATSMMKMITNGGYLLGVWGGAVPELFEIIDRDTGKTVDVLKTNITHDELVEGLGSGKYAITNGYLIEYDKNKIKMQNGIGPSRRPHMDSLLTGLEGVGEIYRDQARRGAQIWNDLRNSDRVDIERSQARAHIKMWGEAAKRKQAFEDLMRALSAYPNFLEILQRPVSGFAWKKMDGSVAWDQAGIPGLLNGFRDLRAKGGDNLLDSIRFHLSNGHPEGDVLAYINDVLDEAAPSSQMEALKAYLKEEFFKFSEKPGAAQVSSENAIEKPANTGGIDLNASLVELKIKRDKNGGMAPYSPAQLVKFQINGLAPVRLRVSPIKDLPAALGITPQQDKQNF